MNEFIWFLETTPGVWMAVSSVIGIVCCFVLVIIYGTTDTNHGVDE